MKTSLKDKNLRALLCVWAGNVVVFSYIVMDLSPEVPVMEVWEMSLESLFKALIAFRATGLFAVLLGVVHVFNGAIPRAVKERLVFWSASRPGSRAFSHFMFRDSTIDRTALQEHFGPLPSEPDEQNALWVKWLHEFEDDVRVRSYYRTYLFARDWAAIAVLVVVLGGLMALWFMQDVERIAGYCAFLLGQLLLACLIARVQGEQMVMSVLSCKGASLGTRSGDNKEEV